MCYVKHLSDENYITMTEHKMQALFISFFTFM